MRLDDNGEFIMSQVEVVEFSTWLDRNPRERYKQFNEVVQTFMTFNNKLSA